MIKLKLEFDGWINLSVRQQKEILNIARNNFKNANFVIDRSGLLIEDEDELKIHKFCIDIVHSFTKTFKALDGYAIKKLSSKNYISINSIKRRLSLEQFKKIINDNASLDEKCIVLAGILYVSPEEVKNILVDLKNLGSEKEIIDILKTLVVYAGTKQRTFAL